MFFSTQVISTFLKLAKTKCTNSLAKIQQASHKLPVFIRTHMKHNQQLLTTINLLEKQTIFLGYV